MREALFVASQQHQAKVFNRRVKFCDIQEGDQVLLANEGERGSKMLADKRESPPYAMIARDPKCHTYRITGTANGRKLRKLLTT